MSVKIVFNASDALYKELENLADEEGTTIENLLLDMLNDEFGLNEKGQYVNDNRDDEDEFYDDDYYDEDDDMEYEDENFDDDFKKKDYLN